jgi:hypothetical protein
MTFLVDDILYCTNASNEDYKLQVIVIANRRFECMNTPASMVRLEHVQGCQRPRFTVWFPVTVGLQIYW